jgi:diphthamide synthase subunit DPH2
MIIRIAGNIQLREQFVTVRTALEQRGHQVILPKKDEREPVTKEQKRQYLQKVQDELENVDALLVMNYDQDIASVVLLQIGVARYFEKQVFIYSELPREYKEELEALAVVVLHGDLSKLK